MAMRELTISGVRGVGEFSPCGKGRVSSPLPPLAPFMFRLYMMTITLYLTGTLYSNTRTLQCLAVLAADQLMNNSTGSCVLQPADLCNTKQTRL